MTLDERGTISACAGGGVEEIKVVTFNDSISEDVDEKEPPKESRQMATAPPNQGCGGTLNTREVAELRQRFL